MPKPGYACITLKADVVKLLKQRAEEEGLGLDELLLKLLEKDYPGIVPSIVECRNQNNSSTSLFLESTPGVGFEPTRGVSPTGSPGLHPTRLGDPGSYAWLG